jgi:hypothetical protein
VLAGEPELLTGTDEPELLLRADEPELLAGGVANAGAVVRVGPHVLRPAGPHHRSVSRLLRHLPSVGFDGASVPVGAGQDGRERLLFIPGDVAIPPYPEWAQTDESLASVAALLRRYHDAARSFVPAADDDWSDEMSDPGLSPGAEQVLCHNDVCLENVVFVDGEAMALLDFDFAAPGRIAYDLSQLARLCIPIDHDPARLGWGPGIDPVPRLGVVADAYGLGGHQRAELFGCLAEGVRRGGEFVQRRMERGDPNFLALWTRLGGRASFDRRRAWFTEHAVELRRTLGLA